MRENFEAWINNLREWEGFGDNDPDDPGGETVFGLARAYNSALSPWPPTWEQAQEVYLQKYWIANGCDELPFPMDVLHADSCVNPGPGAAKGFRMQSGEHADPYCRCVEYATLRLRYYLAAIRKRPVALKYLAGWTDRTLDMLERTVLTKWSLEGK